ncbi:hypothetical protein XELAEV_18033139mg [Xenopus laevis]|uniref:Uncharacterized protein n=1 Tax=Xenopus laevis TaxID=8355 RepID=A0A974CK83_XENLA|nr:hypothetical protein XELAEV_18033139mg [Xenopus laevis]
MSVIKGICQGMQQTIESLLGREYVMQQAIVSLLNRTSMAVDNSKSIGQGIGQGMWQTIASLLKENSTCRDCTFRKYRESLGSQDGYSCNS